MEIKNTSKEHYIFTQVVSEMLDQLKKLYNIGVIGHYSNGCHDVRLQVRHLTDIEKLTKHKPNIQYFESNGERYVRAHANTFGDDVEVYWLQKEEQTSDTSWEKEMEKMMEETCLNKEIYEHIKKESEKKMFEDCFHSDPAIPEGSARTATHYQVCRMQPIEIMQDVMRPEEFIGFLRGNVIKYALRMGHKDVKDEREAGKIEQYAKWLRQALEGKTINPAE